jgi:hypothetical protein
MPIQIFSGYFRFAMQRKLSDALRKAYARSAEIACEQVAAIRTVASLNREPHILRDFEDSLKQPVHEAMMKTLKSTGVDPLACWVGADYSFMHSVWVINSSHLLSYFGMGVFCWRMASILLLNSLSRTISSGMANV